MKFPLSWLKEFVSPPYSSEKFSEVLTLLGFEVDAMEKKGEDVLFEVALTPNLSHGASILGLAREIAAYSQEKTKRAPFSLNEDKSLKIEDFIKIEIGNLKSCPRYTARMVLGVKVGPSPEWLQKRIENSGFRSVNNVVDVTNLVMLELGHPLHAFDYDKIQGKKLLLKDAKKGEKITTLDGKERVLNEEMLLISDLEKPLVVAGVMGSLEAEVDETTKNVLIESAYFDPASIRKTSKKLSLHTEASRRYERGTDIESLLPSLERATFLMQQVAGGKVVSGHMDVGQKEFPLKKISLRLSRVNHILGIHLSQSEVEDLLKRLHFQVSRAKSDFEVTVPSFRVDVKEEIDLIEEIARLYGYNHLFEEKKPLFYQASTLDHHPIFPLQDQVREAFLNLGLQEFLTSDLISQKESTIVAEDAFGARSLIKLLNPSSEDYSVLRPSLLPNLLHVVKANANQGVFNVAGFEVGRVHFKSKEHYLEPTSAAFIITGKKEPFHFTTKEGSDFDFLDLKGILECFFEKLKVEDVLFLPSHYSNFHPLAQAKMMVGETLLGIMGELHPETLKASDLKMRVFFAELNMDELSKVLKPEVKMAKLHTFPSSSRDWTLTLHEECSIGELLEHINLHKTSLLEEVTLLDIFTSEKVGKGWKNVTLRFIYRDPSETLSFERVEKEHTHLIQNVITKLKSKIRIGS